MCANDILANFQLDLNSALRNVLNERQLIVLSKPARKKIAFFEKFTVIAPPLMVIGANSMSDKGIKP